MVRFGVMLVGPTLGGKTARETQREFDWPIGQWQWWRRKFGVEFGSEVHGYVETN